MTYITPITHDNNMFIGIDGGGSKCKAKLLSADHTRQGIGVSGRANPVQGFDRAVESIIDSASKALEDAGLSRRRLCDVTAGVGLAGVNLPSAFEQISNWNHPFKKMHLTTDLHIACLGAHDYKDGSVIICGTGSCGITINNTFTRIYGAHGLPLGDQGSGAWLGVQALSAILLSNDGLGPATALSDVVCDYLGTTPDQVTNLMINKPSKEFAKLAPLVFEVAEADDPTAVSIVKAGAGYLNDMAEMILDDHDSPLAMIGGLRGKMIEWFSPDVRDRICEPAHAPEDGALYYAKTQSEISQPNSV